MIGMDRRTGQPISGIEHLRQCIEDILTTPLAAAGNGPTTVASYAASSTYPLPKVGKAQSRPKWHGRWGDGNPGSVSARCVWWLF